MTKAVTSDAQGGPPTPIVLALSAREHAILARVGRLSPREAMVFALTGEGHHAKAIAGLLDCSPRTIETHILRARAKLGGDQDADEGGISPDEWAFLSRVRDRSRATEP